MRSRIVIGIIGVILSCGGLTKAAYIDIYENTTINSDLDAIVTVHWSAQITVLPGGSATVFYLSDTSSALVYGGQASYEAQDSSVLNLYGGTFGSVRYTDSLAKIYVYGQNFDYNPSVDNNGWLSGNWLNEDETEFNIYFRNLPQPFEQSLGTNIFLIPEPATMTLFILGMMFTIRRVKKITT
jgi:hypothetical protein